MNTDKLNTPNYPAHGHWGEAARDAVGECAFCSQVYLNTFCE